MFVALGDNAVNIDNCDRIYIDYQNGVRLEKSDAEYVIAKFDTKEQAQEYLALILQAYNRGDKVF